MTPREPCSRPGPSSARKLPHILCTILFNPHSNLQATNYHPLTLQMSRETRKLPKMIWKEVKLGFKSKQGISIHTFQTCGMMGNSTAVKMEPSPGFKNYQLITKLIPSVPLATFPPHPYLGTNPRSQPILSLDTSASFSNR